MTARSRRAGVAVPRTPPSACAAIAPLLACAYSGRLPDDAAEKARLDGARMADDRTHGYSVADHVLFDAHQPLSQVPAAREVEAVVIGTPFERVRYASYLASLQGEPMSAARAIEVARQLDDTLHVVVFAHSPSADEADKGFLDRYRDVTLTFDGTASLHPVERKVFGPARDFFSVPDAPRERRWLGTLTWTFAIGPSVASGPRIPPARLSFRDSSGHAYAFALELDRFR